MKPDMTTAKARINDDGRILIPAAMRKALGLRAGGAVVLRADESGIHLTTQRALRDAQQQLRRYVREGTPLVEDLLAERRREGKREA